MKQLLFLIALTCFSAITVRAQNSWIPKDVRTSTLLIEEFKYYDPNNTLTGVDEDYEDMKDEFLENTCLDDEGNIPRILILGEKK